MVSKMKKEKDLFGLLIRDIAAYAAEIIIAACSIIGILYGVSLIAELLCGILTIEMGLFIFFTIAGLALYIDFRPEKKNARSRQGNTQPHPAVKASSNRMLRVYSAK